MHSSKVSISYVQVGACSVAHRADRSPPGILPRTRRNPSERREEWRTHAHTLVHANAACQPTLLVLRRAVEVDVVSSPNRCRRCQRVVASILEVVSVGQHTAPAPAAAPAAAEQLVSRCHLAGEVPLQSETEPVLVCHRQPRRSWNRRAATVRLSLAVVSLGLSLVTVAPLYRCCRSDEKR